MSQREQVMQALSLVSDKDLGTILEVVLRFASVDPDDILSAEDVEDIREADEQYAAGEWYDLDNTDWNNTVIPE